MIAKIRMKKTRKINRKQQVYEAITGFMLKNGYPPSMRELSELTGLKSICSISQYMTKLKEEGQIDFDPYSSRTIRVRGIEYRDSRDVQ